MIQEKEIQSLSKEIAPFVEKATKVTIANPKQLTEATEILSQINKYADTVEAKKKEITTPLNTALKAARGLFAPLEGRLDEAIQSIRSAMSHYQTAQMAKQRNEESKLADRVAKGNLKIDTAVRKLEEMDKPVEKVVTDSGSIKFREDKIFTVMDVTMLPIEYILPNEVEIRKAMKAGIELPGVKYETVMIPVNSR